MAASNQYKNDLSSGKLTRNTKTPSRLKALQTADIPVVLNSEAIALLIENALQGDRNFARSILSRTLNINDVIAEYCLRHLEDKLKSESNYRECVLDQFASLDQGDWNGRLKFLEYAFGVHGIVSQAILNHLKNTSLQVSGSR